MNNDTLSVHNILNFLLRIEDLLGLLINSRYTFTEHFTSLDKCAFHYHTNENNRDTVVYHCGDDKRVGSHVPIIITIITDDNLDSNVTIIHSRLIWTKTLSAKEIEVIQRLLSRINLYN